MYGDTVGICVAHAQLTCRRRAAALVAEAVLVVAARQIHQASGGPWHVLVASLLNNLQSPQLRKQAFAPRFNRLYRQ